MNDLHLYKEFVHSHAHRLESFKRWRVVMGYQQMISDFSLYTLPEAAEELGISVITLNRRLKMLGWKKRLPQWRFTKEELEELR